MLPNKMSQKCMHMFSSTSFIVWVLTFRCLVYLEFVFICVWDRDSTSCFLHVDLQKSWHYCWKAVLSSTRVLAPLSKISWTQTDGCISYTEVWVFLFCSSFSRLFWLFWVPCNSRNLKISLSISTNKLTGTGHYFCLY